MTKKLIQNEIKCKSCGDIIWSAHRHDFKYCKCGAVFIDGGMSYHRSGGDLSKIEDRTLYLEGDTIKSCIKAVDCGEESGRNSLGIALAVIRALRESGNFVDDS